MGDAYSLLIEHYSTRGNVPLPEDEKQKLMKAFGKMIAGMHENDTIGIEDQNGKRIGTFILRRKGIRKKER